MTLAHSMTDRSSFRGFRAGGRALPSISETVRSGLATVAVFATMAIVVVAVRTLLFLSHV